MSGQGRGKLDPRKVGGIVASLVVAGIVAAWQGPNISDGLQKSAKNDQEMQQIADSTAADDARLQARKDALAAREKALGVRGAIDEIMAKKELTPDDSANLSAALETYADSLGPDTMSYNSMGAVTFKGPQTAYLTRVFSRTQATSAGAPPPRSDTPPAKTSSVPVAQTPPSSVGWHTVAHFTGRSIKDTPRFTVSVNEWRIRWKAQGDGIFQVYAYGPDGMPQPAANVQGTGSDESYVHGAGSYYLSINTTERYEVWVEAQ